MLQRQSEAMPRLKLEVGQLVLVRKPFFEKAAGLILPQCSGPYEILKLPDEHNAVLVDPLSGIPFQGGKRGATHRLAVFKFPTQWLLEDQAEMQEQQLHEDLALKDYVAVDVSVGGKSSLHVARITKQ